MPVVRFLLWLIDFVADFAGKIVSFLMSFAIGVLIYAVLLRYIFHSPWKYETISTNFLVANVMLGAAYAFRSGAFINIDILARRFPVRVRAVIDILTSVLLFIFLLALMQTAAHYALEILPLRFTPKLLFPNRWPIKLFYPAGVGLLILQGVGRLIRNLIITITGKEQI